MNYKFSRALGFSVLFYLSTFIVALICGAALGDNNKSLNEMPEVYWYLGMVSSVILSYVFTSLYLRNRAIVSSPKSGLFFALNTIIIAFVFDLIFFTIGNSSSDPSIHTDVAKYYGDYRFWIITILVLVTSVLTGYKKSSKPQV